MSDFVIQRQFWRDSEQQWVDHVLIHRNEKPTKWRHRQVKTVVTVGEWESGKGRG